MTNENKPSGEPPLGNASKEKAGEPEKVSDSGGEAEDSISGGEANPVERNERWRALIKQGARYLVVGFSSFALEFLLFAGLYELVAVHVVVSNVIAIIGSSLYNFIMSRSWTFKSSSSLLRSVILYLLLFFWNQLFSSWTILFLMEQGISALFAKVVTMAIIVCWNFVLYRKVVFV